MQMRRRDAHFWLPEAAKSRNFDNLHVNFHQSLTHLHVTKKSPPSDNEHSELSYAIHITPYLDCAL